MSYILDALRRAEADRERERSAVPGLHTPALPGGDTPAATASRRWQPWAGGGLLLLAGLGAGGWWASSLREEPQPLPHEAAPASAAASVPVSVSMQEPVAASAPLAAAPQPPVASTPASASPFLPPAPVAAPAPAVAPAVAAAPAPIPAWSELPEATRRALPKLSLGGSVYSDDPASRLVIINGEVLHEGASLGADLVLEQIRPRDLVLRFRGQRYRLPV